MESGQNFSETSLETLDASQIDELTDAEVRELLRRLSLVEDREYDRSSIRDVSELTGVPAKTLQGMVSEMRTSSLGDVLAEHAYRLEQAERRLREVEMEQEREAAPPPPPASFFAPPPTYVEDWPVILEDEEAQRYVRDLPAIKVNNAGPNNREDQLAGYRQFQILAQTLAVIVFALFIFFICFGTIEMLRARLP